LAGVGVVGRERTKSALRKGECWILNGERGRSGCCEAERVSEGVDIGRSPFLDLDSLPNILLIVKMVLGIPRRRKRVRGVRAMAEESSGRGY
jgi:hypothetical protein